LLWNDPALAIKWPFPEGFSTPVLAVKDAAALPLSLAETF
jgi:dTDP-4-dehydrorhamnose 3,5-epimerase-like enzyme